MMSRRRTRRTKGLGISSDRVGVNLEIRSYALLRLLSAIPVLFGISVILFALIQFTPGGPVEQLMAQWRQSGIGETGGGRITAITEEQRQRLVAYYGFDKPLTVRYFSWLGKTLRGDLGESYHSDEPVLTLLKRHLPVSIALGLLSFLLTYAVCLPLGIAKAMRPHTLFDRLTTAFIIFLYSIPPFTLGILLLVFLGGGSFLDLFPLAGVTSDRFGELSFFDKIFDLAHHLTLPVLCYTAGGFASLTLLMKSSLLDQLQQDYLRTARAKGLPGNRVVFHHALKGALIPIATSLGHWLSLFFAGSLLIETLFGLPGIGRLSYEAVLHRDYPVILATILLLSALHIAGNLLSDFLYTRLDPRIRLS